MDLSAIQQGPGLSEAPTLLLKLCVTESPLEMGGFVRLPVSESEGIQPGSPDLLCSPAPFKTLSTRTVLFMCQLKSSCSHTVLLQHIVPSWAEEENRNKAKP